MNWRSRRGIRARAAAGGLAPVLLVITFTCIFLFFAEHKTASQSI